MSLKNKIVTILVFSVLFGICLKKVIDYQDYNPTVIIQSNKFQNQEKRELLKDNKINSEFKAQNNNLGIVSILFNTHNRINDDYLQFRLKEKGSDGWYYSNKYSANQFQDNQYFSFGFPEIKNSKGKVYQIEIESLNGTNENSVQIFGSEPFLSKYSFQKVYLMQNKNEIPIFIMSKIASYFKHISTGIYFSVLLISFLIICLLKLININRLLKFFEKVDKTWIVNNNLFLTKIKKNRLIIFLLIVLSILGLFVINLYVNDSIKLKALAFSDDLNYWNFFNINKNNFFGFIFNTGANKFRPVFNSVFFVLFYFFGNKTWLIGIFNLLFNFLIASLLFFLFRKVSRSIIVSFCLSVAFILSRFSYYDITQALGVMEAMALLLSIIILYLLWHYLNTEKIKSFWISLIVFAMLIFTHERFITLLGVYFVLFLILRLKRKNIFLFILSTLPVILSFVIKIFILHIRPLDGTGGTDILQTFNIGGFFQNFLSGCFYLLGVNAGPAYLNGISSEGVPQNIEILILMANVCLLFIVLIFVFLNLKSKKELLKKYLNNFILFFSFVFFTLIAASVTFRLEMRWLYAPFVGLLFLLTYIFRIILEHKVVGRICLLVIILWLVIFTRTELFYRSYYTNLYYWNTQSLGNALYSITLEKYGDDFWNYDTYIYCADKSSDCINYMDLDLFFSQYNEKNVKTSIHLINNLYKFKNRNIGIILFYDRQNSRFVELKFKDVRELEILLKKQNLNK